MLSSTYTYRHVQYLSFLTDFNETSIFSTYFRKMLKYKISWTSVQLQSTCSRRKNRYDEGNSHFSQFFFCERVWELRLKNCHCVPLCESDIRNNRLGESTRNINTAKPPPPKSRFELSTFGMQIQGRNAPVSSAQKVWKRRCCTCIWLGCAVLISSPGHRHWYRD
jgi:hypothetical protein